MSVQRSAKNKRKFQACADSALVLRASLTIECALVLPLFLLACIILITFMGAIRLQTRTNINLSNRARQLAAAGQGNWIDLYEEKQFSFPVTMPGIVSPYVICRARVHSWSGGSLASKGTSHSERSEEPIVYVSNNRSVYHTHADCSHIDLTIFLSNTNDIKGLRNSGGSRYKPCRGFPKDYSGPVYATSSGTYYYPSLDYASLKRHVSIVKKSECSDLPECSSCRMRDSAA
jgi:hypothetical protein